MKSKYLFCMLAILLVTGTAMALPLMIGELGRKIVVGEGIPISTGRGFSASGVTDTQNAMEYQSFTHRVWDFDNLYRNSPILSIVGDLGITTSDLICDVDTIQGSLSEPATIILIGTGLIGIAGFGRKKLLK